MRKMKNRLSILIAVLVMVSMTGTSVLAYDDVQPAEDPAGTVVNEQEEGVIDETEEPDVVDEEIQTEPEDEMYLTEGKGTDISSAVIDSIPDQKYTGSPIEPAVTVKVGTTTLIEGTDYKLGFANNTNPGTATVTVTGMGTEDAGYYGSCNATFTIAAAEPETLQPVKKLTVLPGNGCFKLTWTPVKGADSYYIERRYAGSKKVNRTRKTDAKETKACAWENAYKINDKKTYQFTIYAMKNGKKSKGTKSAKVKTVRRMVISVVLKQNVGSLKAGKRYNTLGFGSGHFRIKKGKKTYYVSRLKTKSRKANYNPNGKYSRDAVEFFMNGGSTWAKGTGYIKKRKVKAKGNYLIWVNSYNQHVYLLKKKSKKWECIDDWKCSMGQKDTPSPTGHKKIIKKMRHRPGHGAPFWNFITWTSKGHTGTALHGIQPSARSSWLKSLGKLASHGCIRNPDEKAEWIMDHCNMGTMVIIY